MFKILNCNKSVISLCNVIKKIRISRVKNSRKFAHYPNAGEHQIIDKYNYIGNFGIHWTHPQSPYILRVTDDYNQCMKGNQSNDELNTCWWYFPKKILPIMVNDFNEQQLLQIMGELRRWDLIQSASNHYFEWSIGLARIYVVFPNHPFEHKLFGAKHILSTFYTDDAIEKLNSKHEYIAAADGLFRNLLKIFNGTLDQSTDMNQYKGNNIPENFLECATRAIKIQNELGHLAKQLLKPKVYELYVQSCLGYLESTRIERSLYHKHIPAKTIIGELEGRDARLDTIGLKWILPVMMTDEPTAIHLTLTNPIVHLASWISVLENDFIGFCKDKHIEFCPMTFHQADNVDKSELEMGKQAANRMNEAKKVLEYLWENAPSKYSKHYEYVVKYVASLSDYNFVTGLQNSNYRYGWIPRLD